MEENKYNIPSNISEKEYKKFMKEIKTMEMSNMAKDLILDRMVGMYFRVEQLRQQPGYESVTVAELVNRIPGTTHEQQAVKFSWTIDYMLKEFFNIMKEDGEEVDAKIIGNLSQIEAPKGPIIVKV